MKKTLFFLLLLQSSAAYTQSDVGIGLGQATINSNAVLDMSKSNKGLLIPRLSQIGRLSINSPANALMLYDSTLNRTYQLQDGIWRYLINNSYWARSSAANKKHIYSLDSVGLGTSSPDARLEVNGNIRTRSSLQADDDVIAGSILTGDDMRSSGNIFIAGSASVEGNIITQSSVVVDNANPIVQLKTGGVNKGFIQTSGDDFRLGTNSGNNTGKTIIRMDGRDIISIDTSSNFKILIGGSGGNITTGRKVTRQLSPTDNMLPVLFGKVYGNNSQAWLSTSAGIITNTAPGTYEIFTGNARLSGRASLIVTVAGTTPLIATTEYISGVKFKVVIINALTGVLTNSDFNFIALNPDNIYDL